MSSGTIRDAADQRVLYRQGAAWDVNVIAAGGIAQYDKGDAVGLTDTGLITLVENSSTGLYDNLVLGGGSESRALRVTLADEDAPERGNLYTTTTTGVQSLAVRNDYPAPPLASDQQYIPFTTDEVGNARVGVYQTYDMAVRRALISGHRIVEQNGVAPLLHSSPTSPSQLNPITVWPSANLYTGFYTAAETLLVTSTSAADAAAGTGARTITLSKLIDAGGSAASDTILTVGGVPSVATYTRCHAASVTTSGTENGNVGTLSVIGSVSGKVYCTIAPRKNESTQCTYTVPAARTLYMQCLRGSVGMEAVGQNNTQSRYVVFALRYGTFGSILREKFTFAEVKPGGGFVKELMGMNFAAATDIQVDVIDSSNAVNDDLYITAGFVAYEINN